MWSSYTNESEPRVNAAMGTRSWDKKLALRWLIVAPASVALGWLLNHWHVPAAWIVAAIIVSAAMALTTGEELPINREFYAFARGFIGILAALPITGIALGTLTGFVVPGLVVALVTIMVGVVGGVLLHRAQPAAVSQETGILSMLPGGASMMPMLADELGADYRYVALTQYLRLLAVSITLPVVAGLLTSPNHASSQDATHSTWWLVLVGVLVAAFGEKLGKLIRLPVATVLGPMLLTVGISLLLPDDLTMQPPEIFRVMAFLSIGWVCGGGLSVPALKSFSKQLPATILFIVAVIGICAATAWPLTLWLDITYFEAYLATSPGALETVLALSSEGGAGPAVVALQIIRLVLVLAVAGYLPQLIRLFQRRR